MAEVFEASDLDIAKAIISEQYTSIRMKAHGDRHRMRIVQDHLGQLSLDRMRFRMGFKALAEPMGIVCVGRVQAGRISYRRAGDEVQAQRGDIFMPVQPDASFEVTLEDLEAEYCLIRPELLAEIAQPAPGTTTPIRLLAPHPVSPAAGTYWTRTYAVIRTFLETGPHLRTSPLVTAQAARLMAATTLATFPNTALVEPTIEDRHDAHPETVRRAVAYIETNPDLDLAVADIASAAHVTIRAIQLAFQRHLDTTPTTYLRRVRLDRAHQDLLAANPRTETVTAIATRWGFPNPSRFAAAYRETYGHPPSHTLNN